MTKQIHCSFCGKGRNQVSQMIAGPDLGETTVYICNECIDFSHKVIREHVTDEVTEEDVSITPEEIKSRLDEEVIEQEYAKTVLSVALYNHRKRINNPEAGLEKSNVLLIGPSGCGKTQLAKSIARMLDLPFTIGDATTFSETGYQGEDAETLVTRLIEDAGGDIEKAQHGVVYVDEIDKKSRKTEGSNVRDVSGEGVQQALLKLVEGSTVMVDNPATRKAQKFDTTNVLFIVGGAFVGLDEIVKKSKTGATTMGFGSDLGIKDSKSELLAQATPDDIISFGLIPEFVGRFPVIVPLHELDRNTLYRILTEPKNNLVKQFTESFQLDNVDLEFSEEYLRSISSQCFDLNIGARGLRSMMEKSLLQTQFQLPSLNSQGVQKVVVDPTGNIKMLHNSKKVKNEK